ncbi:hypothetical protein [Saccharothrix variisporea]|uniref:Helix-turn-helix protein n=1 Tax=Saccharothrix variisporea TaxID=543527 RepID=A0A495XAT1_9PSEU|nr:hypothetical protein [Saccharothrix variisporea]RKT69954.1 hypothetical protein DFJ66_3193 [Saccharothrix variisporea]
MGSPGAAPVGRGERFRVLGLLRGDAPDPSRLRRLAPVLGLHPPDLFAIAGVDVPDDLAPVDPRAGRWVPGLVRNAVALRAEQRNALRGYVASLPQEERVRPAPTPSALDRYPDGPGAVLMRLARNRNLDRTALAKTFLVVTGRYWSAATYGGVGRGTTPVTPDLLADFCAVLDVPSDDLVSVTGVALPPSGPAAAGVAELIWDVRRLTESQVREVGAVAESMQG